MVFKRSYTLPPCVQGLGSGNDGHTYWSAQVVGETWEEARFEVLQRKPRTHKQIGTFGAAAFAAFDRDLDYRIIQTGRWPLAVGIAPERSGFVVVITDPQPYPIHVSVRKLPWDPRPIWFTTIPTRSRLIKVRALDVNGDLVTETEHDEPSDRSQD